MLAYIVERHGEHGAAVAAGEGAGAGGEPVGGWPRQRVRGGAARVAVSAGTVKRTYGVGRVGRQFRVTPAEPSHNASALAAHMAGEVLSDPKESALAPQSPWAPPPAFGFPSGGSEDELFEAAEDEGVFLSR